MESEKGKSIKLKWRKMKIEIVHNAEKEKNSKRMLDKVNYSW